MFNKHTPSYLDSYLAIVESDLAVAQEAVNEARINSGSSMDLSVQQTRINMSHRAIESLRTPITPRS